MKNCLRLAVFALVVVLFASCGKSPKGIAESRMKSAVDSWVKMRGERKGLVLKSYDVTDKDVIVSNDSVCVMLIHLVISGDRGTDEADVNYIVAKRNDRYSELFIYKKYNNFCLRMTISNRIGKFFKHSSFTYFWCCNNHTSLTKTNWSN